MLLEILTDITATSAKGARKAGLVYELAAIRGRVRRHRKAWTPHLDRTKKAIENALTTADPHKPVLVLGAGLCLDLPLKALNAHKAGAVLVDAVLPLSTRISLLRYRNIKFWRHDITGFLQPFWCAGSGETIPMPAAAPLPLDGYSLVISANILSQLPLPFADNPPADDTEKRITRALQKMHLDFLKATACPSLLISDYERHSNTQENKRITPTVLPDILPSSPLETWWWDIAPLGEVSDSLHIQLKTGCWLFSAKGIFSLASD